MTFDIEMIKSFYKRLSAEITAVRTKTNHSLSLAEKILYAHMSTGHLQLKKRGNDYAFFRPDRVAMQDATAQMALLQFMQAGLGQTAVPTTVHCDHLILAEKGARNDLLSAHQNNKEIFDFLQSASSRYGIGFWKPGAGIIHQVILENYAFPGGMMIGTDSHTPNAGGLGMLAIGVGGADAVDVMSGMDWELKFPKLIGVKLTGKLSGWSSAKDVILKVAGILTVKGGTGFILEYFGEGAQSLSATGKATICNMGAEIGATTSLFGFDDKMKEYLEATARKDIATEASKVVEHLTGDAEVYANPEKYFDQVIEINLSGLEPHINGPFSPDKAWKISEFAKAVKENNYPKELEVGLIGSCTNSSYEDITRAASIAQQALDKNLKVRSEFTVTPGSEQVRYTIERDGLLQVFEKIGGTLLANACGPCIGQWARHGDPNRKNSIITSFNRNFAKRNDGNPNTHAFVASPEIVTAMAIAGDLTFNPMTDELINENGVKVKLEEPKGMEFPVKGFEVRERGYVPPAENQKAVRINPDSDRLQELKPFNPWDGKDFSGLPLLVKALGKCTTDHISMAGPWLRYRGHLENISRNLLMGATNAFNRETNLVKNQVNGEMMTIPDSAATYRKAGVSTIIIGDENYGEGSSREHAAMEPRFMGVKAVIVRSFARIHETNLKKQGILALTFRNPSDYDLIQEDDRLDITGIAELSPGKDLRVTLHHADGSKNQFEVSHSYNENQIEWFKAGSALNLIRKTIQG